MKRAIQAAVLGASGYVGGELLRLLATHPAMTLSAAVSDSRAGEKIGAVFPNLAHHYGDTRFVSHEEWPDRVDRDRGLALFSAAPHGASARLVAAAVTAAAARGSLVHVVDASADFRYSSPEAFAAVYGEAHGAPGLLAQFSSGLPEHVAGTPTPHIGHPGCFATAILLAAVPLLRAGVTDGEMFVSGITGSSGSGREPQSGTHHPERHGNLYAYKVLAHRHAPEVTSLAKLAAGRAMMLRFVPHSGPFARGIHVTLQARLQPGTSAGAVREAFEASYRDAPFVDLLDGTPKIKNVIASNRAQLCAVVDKDTVAVCCAIDNLVKGAAGGSIQWMNRLWGLPETSGLLAPSPAWA